MEEGRRNKSTEELAHEWASWEEKDERDELDVEVLEALTAEDQRLLLRLILKLSRSDDATFDNSKLAGRFVSVLCQGLRATKGGLFTRLGDQIVALAAREIRMGASEAMERPLDVGVERFSETSIREAFDTGEVRVADVNALRELTLALPMSVRLNMPGPRVHVPLFAPASGSDAGKPFAVLALGRAEGLASFSDKVPLLEELATMMAPILYRSQLYQDAKETLSKYDERLREAEERVHAVELELSASAKKAFHEIVYGSEVMKSALDRAKYAAGSRTLPVLIIGPSGVGKGQLARGIHALSPRRAKPFVKKDCGGKLDATQLYAELFGAKKGAYTGCTEDRIGCFQLANGGTVFLDEIGNASGQIQEMLLQVLEEQHITRLGDPKPIPIDVRVIAATNTNLPAAIEAEKFREDLYYRLKGVVVEIPELRERRGDIPLLAEHFLQKYLHEEGIERMSFTVEAMEILRRAPWVGNVRELRNVVHAAALFAKGTLKIRESHVRMAMDQGSDSPPAARPSGGGVSKERLAKALEATNWSATRTARTLGISRTHVYYLKHRYGLKEPAERAGKQR